MNKKDYKLFFTLILWALIPSIYTLIRMNIVSISNVDINILGQMEWFDLIDEIIVTTLTVPLYYLLKTNYSDKHKNGSAFIVSSTIYALFTLVVALNVSSVAEFMEAEFASQYLLLQSISMLISFVSSFSVIVFTLNDKSKLFNVLLLLKIACLLVCDFSLIPGLKDVGTSYSEIIANSIVSISAFIIMLKSNLIAFENLKFKWMISWLKIGTFSGLQIFIDNFVYAIMICKMVNAVSESGNYWVANNFIWGWLLVPVLCCTEIIKKNNLEKLTFKNSWRYGLMIAGLWTLTMPGWKLFLTKCMAVEASVVLKIVYPSVLFYLAYIPSSFIDGWFISKGKVLYNTINSLIVNVIYYGIVYVLFKNGVFEQNISFIVYMFGFGMVVHMIISICLYIFENNKQPKLMQSNC